MHEERTTGWGNKKKNEAEYENEVYITEKPIGEAASETSHNDSKKDLRQKYTSIHSEEH